MCCLILVLACSSCQSETSGTPTNSPARTPSAGTPANPSPLPSDPTGQSYSPYRTDIPSGAVDWISRVGKAGNEILLTPEAIQDLNIAMRSNCDALTDILTPPAKFTKKSVYEQIIAASNPSLPNYTEDGTSITHVMLEGFLANRNLNGIPASVSVKKGIVTQRSDLRTLPTSTAFYRTASDKAYDQIQETELLVGMPVWVLHTSLDGLFYYIQTYFYRGWVSVEAVALTEEDSTWRSFADPSHFVIITVPSLTVSGSILNMSVKLPCTGEETAGFVCLLPIRDADGRLSSTSIQLTKAQAYDGYLSYTQNNVLIQAFLYEGTPYAWGGKNGGVDCSSFVCNVFRCFGLQLPRNTSQQQTSVGRVIDLQAMDKTKKQETLDGVPFPTLLYSKGHVMLYLGKNDTGNVILHAPQAGKTVSTAGYNNLDGLLYAAVVG